MDLGVTQEVLGSVLFEALGTFARGRGRTAQVQDLLVKLKEHHGRMRTPNRLNALTVDMIKRDGKAPKMRAKGAETRHLVPFALEVATAMHALLDTTHSLTVLQCVSALLDFCMTFGISPCPEATARDT